MADTTTMGHDELLQVKRPVSRLSWGGIIAGAIATIALGILFLSLGAAIGLTGLNPAAGMGSQAGGGGGISPVWSGIWMFLSIVLATFLGAWIGSRHATLFVKRDAMAQGTIVWALSLLLTMVYVGWTGGMLARTGTQLVGSTLQTAGSLAGAGAQALPQTQLGQQMQQQLNQQQLQQMQQQLPSGQQLAQPIAQAADTATDVGAAFTWWFFITALFGLGAGILGGLAGLPEPIRKRRQLETRRQPGLRESESRA